MPTIYEVLHQDHEQVARMLKQVGSTSANESDKRKELLKEVQHDLEVHMQFEEGEAYPAFQKAMGKGELKHAVKEHREAMNLLKDLTKAVEKGDSGWKSQLKELETAIQHHVSEEENEIFPQVQEKLSKTEAEKLASHYRTLKKKMAAE